VLDADVMTAPRYVIAGSRPAMVLAGVPFRRGCRQMPRSGRLAHRADPADLK
jgi:hypothetical protein